MAAILSRPQCVPYGKMLNISFIYRREPLNEAHDPTFGILENYHCWRFHGSGVIAALQIIGLIFFCTG